MKRKWMIVIGILSALSITACGGSQDTQKETASESQTVSEVQTTAGDTGTAAEEASENTAETASENTAETGEAQLYCIVDEATADTLKVSDMEGNTYTFEVKDSGLKLNDKIFVYYTGNLEDGSAQVLRIEKYEDGE